MTALGLVVFPVVAGIIGAVVGVVRTPPPALVSGVQHFAAGIVMAAVAGEVLPELRDIAPLWVILVGFAAGVALLLFMRRFEAHGPHDDEHDGPETGVGVGAVARAVIPVGFLVVIGVDLFIDGLLVGAGAAVSAGTAMVIAIALTVEVLFLGLTVALRLNSAGLSKGAAAGLTAGINLLVVVGAVLGAIVLAGASATVLGLVLAFAAAALLWLVVEELLVEAHEGPEKAWMAAMFFVGFIALFSLEAVGG